MRMKENPSKLRRFSFYFLRYLNTHYVKKRQTSELDNSYPPFECNNDNNNDLPLVEIGEVIFMIFMSLPFNLSVDGSGLLDKTYHRTTQRSTSEIIT
jgi:hypothetical protein